jgi:hypothetical protein
LNAANGFTHAITRGMSFVSIRKRLSTSASAGVDVCRQ